MEQLFTKVSCSIDYGKEKDFFFGRGADGLPRPLYCEDSSECEACHRCSVTALKKLTVEFTERNQYR
jgi:hypothetical protein